MSINKTLMQRCVDDHDDYDNGDLFYDGRDRYDDHNDDDDDDDDDII